MSYSSFRGTDAKTTYDWNVNNVVEMRSRAGDPTLPDTLVREADLARLAARSPEVESRVADGCGHLIHDSRRHRAMVLAAIEDLLARV